jgi:hypothetical protein
VVAVGSGEGATFDVAPYIITSKAASYRMSGLGRKANIRRNADICFCADSDQILQRSEMSRCANSDRLDCNWEA